MDFITSHLSHFTAINIASSVFGVVVIFNWYIVEKKMNNVQTDDAHTETEKIINQLQLNDLNAWNRLLFISLFIAAIGILL